MKKKVEEKIQQDIEQVNDTTKVRRAKILERIWSKIELATHDNMGVFFVDSKGTIVSKNQFLLVATPLDSQANQLKSDNEKKDSDDSV